MDQGRPQCDCDSGLQFESEVGHTNAATDRSAPFQAAGFAVAVQQHMMQESQRRAYRLQQWPVAVTSVIRPLNMKCSTILANCGQADVELPPHRRAVSTIASTCVGYAYKLYRKLQDHASVYHRLHCV